MPATNQERVELIIRANSAAGRLSNTAALLSMSTLPTDQRALVEANEAKQAVEYLVSQIQVDITD